MSGENKVEKMSQKPVNTPCKVVTEHIFLLVYGLLSVSADCLYMYANNNNNNNVHLSCAHQLPERSHDTY